MAPWSSPLVTSFERSVRYNEQGMASTMNKRRTGLALAALTLCGACSTPLFEPTPNWWIQGGRLCAADREDLNWTRAAPRSCAQALSDAPSLRGTTKEEG